MKKSVQWDDASRVLWCCFSEFAHQDVTLPWHFYLSHHFDVAVHLELPILSDYKGIATSDFRRVSTFACTITALEEPPHQPSALAK